MAAAFMTLLSLHEEILLMVFSELTIPDLLACKQTCRNMSSVVENSVRRRYRIELYAAGLVDGPPGGLSIKERLQALDQY